MLRIIINGCNGRMGQTLAQVAEEAADVEVTAGIDPIPSEEVKHPFPVYKKLAECDKPADLIIDFSMPEVLPELLAEAEKREMPLLIATTGHTDQDLGLIRKKAGAIPIFQAANMSLGVNLMSELVQGAAKVLGDEFDVEIIEKHHNLKKDAPSGTAYKLADSINRAYSEKKRYVFGRHTRNERRSADEIGIHAVRAGTIVGDHQVIFSGKDEILEISHSARSKRIFAVGALQAARYLQGKAPGYYSMQDMIAEQSLVTNLYSSENEALISVSGLPADPKRIAGIFDRIGEEKINLDMISQTAPLGGEVSISFTLLRDDADRAGQIIGDLRDTAPNLGVQIDKEIAKITAEGIGMETQSGVAARVFNALAAKDIEIRSITTSETKISLIIDQKKTEKALSSVREMFGI